MQTYSHLVIAAVLNRQVRNRESEHESIPVQGGEAAAALPSAHTGAFLIGSVAPDLPLIFLFFVYLFADLAAGNPLNPGGDDATIRSNVGWLFDYAFFNVPWVIALHNLFHAPILTVTYTLVGYWAWRAGRRWGRPLFRFGLACTLHTLIDIPTHYSDGPLIFFPFNWSYRFSGPVSYWDPARGAIWFAIFEHLLVLGCLIYLVVDWRLRRKRAQLASTGSD